MAEENNTTADILKNILDKEPLFKSTVVSKQIDLNLDVGCLLAEDINPVNENLIKKYVCVCMYVVFCTHTTVVVVVVVVVCVVVVLGVFSSFFFQFMLFCCINIIIICLLLLLLLLLLQIL